MAEPRTKGQVVTALRTLTQFGMRESEKLRKLRQAKENREEELLKDRRFRNLSKQLQELRQKEYAVHYDVANKARRLAARIQFHGLTPELEQQAQALIDA